MIKAAAVAAALLLLGTGQAFASCTSTSSFGAMGPPALRLFGNDFGSATSFTDCYSFTLAAPADIFGTTFETDLSLRLDIQLASATVSGGTLVNPIVDTTPGAFAFAGLGAGSYLLEIAGSVTTQDPNSPFATPVAYAGTIQTAAADIAVPEPGALALLGGGVAALAMARRRKPR